MFVPLLRLIVVVTSVYMGVAADVSVTSCCVITLLTFSSSALLGYRFGTYTTFSALSLAKASITMYTLPTTFYWMFWIVVLFWISAIAALGLSHPSVSVTTGFVSFIAALIRSSLYELVSKPLSTMFLHFAMCIGLPAAFCGWSFGQGVGQSHSAVRFSSHLGFDGFDVFHDFLLFLLPCCVLGWNFVQFHSAWRVDWESVCVGMIVFLIFVLFVASKFCSFITTQPWTVVRRHMLPYSPPAFRGSYFWYRLLFSAWWGWFFSSVFSALSIQLFPEVFFVFVETCQNGIEFNRYQKLLSFFVVMGTVIFLPSLEYVSVTVVLASGWVFPFHWLLFFLTHGVSLALNAFGWSHINSLTALSVSISAGIHPIFVVFSPLAIPYVARLVYLISIFKLVCICSLIWSVSWWSLDWLLNQAECVTVDDLQRWFQTRILRDPATRKRPAVSAAWTSANVPGGNVATANTVWAPHSTEPYIWSLCGDNPVSPIYPDLPPEFLVNLLIEHGNFVLHTYEIVEHAYTGRCVHCRQFLRNPAIIEANTRYLAVKAARSDPEPFITFDKTEWCWQDLMLSSLSYVGSLATFISGLVVLTWWNIVYIFIVSVCLASLAIGFQYLCRELNIGFGIISRFSYNNLRDGEFSSIASMSAVYPHPFLYKGVRHASSHGILDRVIPGLLLYCGVLIHVFTSVNQCSGSSFSLLAFIGLPVVGMVSSSSMTDAYFRALSLLITSTPWASPESFTVNNERLKAAIASKDAVSVLKFWRDFLPRVHDIASVDPYNYVGMEVPSPYLDGMRVTASVDDPRVIGKTKCGISMQDWFTGCAPYFSKHIKFSFLTACYGALQSCTPTFVSSIAKRIPKLPRYKFPSDVSLSNNFGAYVVRNLCSFVRATPQMVSTHHDFEALAIAHACYSLMFTTYSVDCKDTDLTDLSLGNTSAAHHPTSSSSAEMRQFGKVSDWLGKHYLWMQMHKYILAFVKKIPLGVVTSIFDKLDEKRLEDPSKVGSPVLDSVPLDQFSGPVPQASEGPVHNSDGIMLRTINHMSHMCATLLWWVTFSSRMKESVHAFKLGAMSYFSPVNPTDPTRTIGHAMAQLGAGLFYWNDGKNFSSHIALDRSYIALFLSFFGVVSHKFLDLIFDICYCWLGSRIELLGSMLFYIVGQNPTGQYLTTFFNNCVNKINQLFCIAKQLMCCHPEVIGSVCQSLNITGSSQFELVLKLMLYECVDPSTGRVSPWFKIFTAGDDVFIWLSLHIKTPKGFIISKLVKGDFMDANVELGFPQKFSTTASTNQRENVEFCSWKFLFRDGLAIPNRDPVVSLGKALVSPIDNQVHFFNLIALALIGCPSSSTLRAVYSAQARVTAGTVHVDLAKDWSWRVSGMDTDGFSMSFDSAPSVSELLLRCGFKIRDIPEVKDHLLFGFSTHEEMIKSILDPSEDGCDTFPTFNRPITEYSNTVITGGTGVGKTTKLIPFLAKNNPSYRFIVMCGTRLAAKSAFTRVRQTSDISVGLSIGEDTFKPHDPPNFDAQVTFCSVGRFVYFITHETIDFSQFVVIMDEADSETVEGCSTTWRMSRCKLECAAYLFMTASWTATTEHEKECNRIYGNVTPATVKYLDGKGFNKTVRDVSVSSVEEGCRTACSIVKSHQSHRCMVICPDNQIIMRLQDLLRDSRRAILVLSSWSQISTASLPPNVIILATEIADRSITIADLDVVISFGLVKREVTVLNEVRISYYSVDEATKLQRQGRVGRTKDGFAYNICHNNSKFHHEIQEFEIDKFSKYLGATASVSRFLQIASHTMGCIPVQLILLIGIFGDSFGSPAFWRQRRRDFESVRGYVPSTHCEMLFDAWKKFSRAKAMSNFDPYEAARYVHVSLSVPTSAEELELYFQPLLKSFPSVYSDMVSVMGRVIDDRRGSEVPYFRLLVRRRPPGLITPY